MTKTHPAKLIASSKAAKNKKCSRSRLSSSRSLVIVNRGLATAPCTEAIVGETVRLKALGQCNAYHYSWYVRTKVSAKKTMIGNRQKYCLSLNRLNGRK